ncbi:MAG TPA: hypothetical protein PK140_08440 [Polyangiaceae bacterium]|nr:hypothetical protein [Polyangiaceae bacterium]
MQEILTKEAASQGLQRLAAEIVDRLSGAEELALVGIRRGGHRSLSISPRSSKKTREFKYL